MSELSREIMTAIDRAADEAHEVSTKIFDWCELGGAEINSSRLLMERLTRLGFQVQSDLPVPADLIPGGVATTAFRGELTGGAGNGPTVTIMLEYDALPIGHACGHNLIAGSGFIAAAGLAAIRDRLPGRVMVLGTPHEEGGGNGSGKIALIEGGAFEGTDVAIISHPLDRWSIDQRLLASKSATFTFHGRPAHAAAAPHLGINALNAVRLTFDAVDMLRQHVPQEVRIHGYVSNGGERTNIVPEKAQAQFQVRAFSTQLMLETYQRVLNCARAGELATGAELDVGEPRTYLKSPIYVSELVDLLAEMTVAAGLPEKDLKVPEGFGSSDLGNVGHDYPTVNLCFAIGPQGIAPHTEPFTRAAASDEGWKAAVLTGKAMALTALSLLTDPDKTERIKKTFEGLKRREQTET